GDKEVVFSGGEPLLHESIIEIIEGYSQRGFKVGLASNGVLITKDTARQLRQAGLRNIQLSFDSAHPETHDFLRGVKGTYEKVLKGAEHLRVYKDEISVCAQTVISGKNISEIKDTIEFVTKDDRFDFISFMAVTTPFFAPVGDDWRSKDEFAFLWPESQEVDRVIDEIIVMKEKGYPIANPVGQFELFRSYFHDPQKRIPEIRCRLGDYVLSVDPGGDIRLCCFMEPIGNIKDDSLSLLMASPSVNEIRSKMNQCGQTCNTLVNCFFQE
ncbi:radical SAM/SPASM domain-containing protein, partial [Candidatus Omnitrophota bacterium]